MLYHQYSCTYACGSYFTEEKKQQRRNFQKFLINSASNLFCNISSSNIICLMKHKSHSKDKSVPATFTWNQRLFASSTIYNMSCFADLENFHQILWEICQNCVGIAAIFFWKLQITVYQGYCTFYNNYITYIWIIIFLPGVGRSAR